MPEPREVPEPRQADFEAWEARASADHQTYSERQASEVFLAALGSTPTFRKKILLKGGILVGAVYASGRNTADLDFSTTAEPSLDFLNQLEAELTEALPSAAATLGTPGTIIKVQSVKYRPRKETFVESNSPAISVKFAYAQQGTQQAMRLAEGKANDIIYADISFNEPIEIIEQICIGDSGLSFFAYSKVELIAEKLRSIIQQKKIHRNRIRRQDTYDIWYLVSNFEISRSEQLDILNIFKLKCESRAILPTLDSLDDGEIYERSKRDWDTLSSEVEYLPDFDEAFGIVRNFYRSIWADNR